MKDPADRFQTCEELIASLQGQPIATAGFARAGGPPTPARPTTAAPPAIASQPTTPINSPSVERRARPRSERGIADRSPQLRAHSASPLVWAPLAVLVRGGGAFFYVRSKAGAESPAAKSDSSATDTT